MSKLQKLFLAKSWNIADYSISCIEIFMHIKSFNFALILIAELYYKNYANSPPRFFVKVWHECQRLERHDKCWTFHYEKRLFMIAERILHSLIQIEYSKLWMTGTWTTFLSACHIEIIINSLSDMKPWKLSTAFFMPSLKILKGHLRWGEKTAKKKLIKSKQTPSSFCFKN